jgi:enoyl-CoA hydratase/carnithine racemase
MKVIASSSWPASAPGQMLWRQLGSPHPMSANRIESAALLELGSMADWSVSGRIFDAQEALSRGLVRELVPQAQVLS